MRTGNLEYTRHIYNLSEKLITHSKYKLDKVLNNENQTLSDIVKYEKDNGFHKGEKYDYRLIIRDTSNWDNCSWTGLRLSTNNIYEGNLTSEVHLPTPKDDGKPRHNPLHFIITQISSDKSIMIVDYFKNFYPCQHHLRKEILKQHQYYLK